MIKLRRNRFIFESCFLYLYLFLSSCFGTENFFLPGDAFFPVVVTRPILEEFQSAPTTYQFSYDTNRLGSSMAGYAGFPLAIIETADSDLARNLKQAYELHRETSPRVLLESTDRDGTANLEEVNGLQCLIYPSTFEFPRYSLGLTYNENWVEEITSFGHPRRAALYTCLVDSAEAVARSWRDAKEVDAIEALLPQITRNRRTRINEPLRITSEVQIMIPVRGTLLEIWHRKPPEFDTSRSVAGPTSLSVWVVKSSGIESIEFIDKKWERRLISEGL